MSIADNIAEPIVRGATKAFEKHYDPNKPTFQLIFHEQWKPFLEAIDKVNISLPSYVINEVERMIAYAFKL